MPKLCCVNGLLRFTNRKGEHINMDDGDSTGDNVPPLSHILNWLRHSLYLQE